MVNTNTRFADRKKRTMMYDVEDLKSRALIESNILKQFILYASAKDRGEFKPKLDDLLIHDYQMANSITLNVILSNYMVDLAYAVNCIDNPIYVGTKDSYFRLVSGSSEGNLKDQTKLVLEVDEVDGTFKTRDLTLQLKQVWNGNENVKKFICLDSIWYCKKMDGSHDTLEILDGMNDFLNHSNPFGGNPFDKELFYPNGNPMEVTFNDWLGEDGKKELNCIIENRFYKNVMKDDKAVLPQTQFGEIITNCRYLLCVPDGFYGLESHWETISNARTFKGFKLHNIGWLQPIFKRSFEYKFCSFHVIGDKDETTLFLAVQEPDEEGSVEPGKYHYFYLNESSIDETYGLTEIDSIVVDQLIVPPSDVFSKVEEVRELDTVNIALTDYGFWDLEENNTNNVTYSYRNGKHYSDNIGNNLNNDLTKLITPTIT